ncbi:reverse transcriptase [Penicillium odoratum]|uniref:reverse transcriptase n=1 Tax=Penicillium odoratum TaxID=1167516 RepID=UPI0025489535|nr:reverse transcriptase [Penicillium odoratum]KAJ5761315.1 reverse transcriptase [Penicillium odoratum]
MKHLFGEEGVRKCDILAIQEPEIFNWMEPEMGVHSQTLGGRFHTLLRPTPTAVREEAARTQPRVCFFVSKGINPKSWSIRHHSRDASTLTVETGAGQLHVHNIYLPGKFNDPERTQEVKEGLAALCVALRGYHSGQHVVVGDFNLHHPLWSTIQQAQLPDDDADDLIRIMGDFGLDLLTEKGTVTFEGPVYGNIVPASKDTVPVRKIHPGRSYPTYTPNPWG